MVICRFILIFDIILIIDKYFVCLEIEHVISKQDNKT